MSKTSDIWVKTPNANLYRYKPTGMYYMRAKILGEDVKRSLDTASFEIAQVKLSTVHADEKSRIQKAKANLGTGPMLGYLLKRFMKSDKANRNIKESTKSHHRDYLRCLLVTWPTPGLPLSFRKTETAKVTKIQCEEWAARLRTMENKRKQKYSPMHYNGTLDIFRLVMQQAVDLGLRADNPAAKLERLEVKRRPIVLPSSAKLKELLARLDAVPERKNAAQIVRFLLYGGPRISTARAVMPEDVDLEKNQIILRATKNDAIIHLPMIPEMRKLVRGLLKEHPGFGPLLKIKNPRKALKKACQEVGIPVLTNHHLRHYFTTACLESGIDVRTVAAWRGDRDNGAMLLRNYAHIRREHSQRMAKRVKL